MEHWGWQPVPALQQPPAVSTVCHQRGRMPLLRASKAAHWTLLACVTCCEGTELIQHREHHQLHVKTISVRSCTSAVVEHYVCNLAVILDVAVVDGDKAGHVSGTKQPGRACAAVIVVCRRPGMKPRSSR